MPASAARQPRPDPAPSTTVRSPCVSVCRIDPRTEWCEGCWRTLDEIADWGTMGDAERLAVWRLIEQRRAVG